MAFSGLNWRDERNLEEMKVTKSPFATTNHPTDSVVTEVESYKECLDRDKEWAMDEGERFFQGTSKTHRALRKIAGKLNELGIDYVVVGGMAMFEHGYRRFTEDVDLLVTREGLQQIHQALEGLGYRPPFDGSKHLRDTEHGVKIEFLVTGQYPGDGKPKPIAFPTPAAVVDDIKGIRYINLPSLVELKLASGMTNPERMKDLSDVIEMIKVLGLPRDFAEKLHPFVQDRYLQLWGDANPPTKRYVTILAVERLATATKSPKDAIAELASVDDELRAMLADGVKAELAQGVDSDHLYLATNDPVVAKKHNMHDESEFWLEDTETKD
jgi:hypothetical protein